MYIIREIKGIPQIFDMKDSTLRLLPYEVKEIASKEVNDEVKKRVSQGYVTLIEKPKPEKNTSSTKSTVTKEETN